MRSGTDDVNNSSTPPPACGLCKLWSMPLVNPSIGRSNYVSRFTLSLFSPYGPRWHHSEKVDTAREAHTHSPCTLVADDIGYGCRRALGLDGIGLDGGESDC